MFIHRIAQESGIFKKYDLEVPLVFVPAGTPAVATILTGDSEVTQQGAGGLVRAFVLGNQDLVFKRSRVYRWGQEYSNPQCRGEARS